MSSNSNSSNNDISLFNSDTQIFYSIQFWIFLVLLIPSLISSFFALYHFVRDRAIRRPLHNHIMFALLIINLFFELTDMSWYTYYFRTFQTFQTTNAFRLVWGFIDWTGFALQFHLYAWVTLERHILIFHDHLVSTRKKRLFFHYLPPIIITIYCFLYYLVIFFGMHCVNNFNNITRPSMFPCAFQINAYHLSNNVCNFILPTLIIVVSSFVLLLRVLWQRYRMRRQINWRQQRKMTVQVLSVSCLYLVFPFPYALVTFIRLCGMPASFGIQFTNLALYVTNYTLLLYPIICIGSIGELRDKIRKPLLFRRQPNAVGQVP